MAVQFPPNRLKSGECIIVPVDVKQNKNFLPSVNCAPIDAAAVTDDRATICRKTSDSGEDLYSVHFKSELAGPFGAGVSKDYINWNSERSWFMMPYKVVGMMSAKWTAPDAYSKYEFQLTPETLSLSGGYAVDAPERAKLAVASAFACWGYHAEDAGLIQFANTLNAAELKTSGNPLPPTDCIDYQKGNALAPRDVAALEVQPDYTLVPELGAPVAQTTALPPLPQMEASLNVPLDVKANDLFPANINFAPLNARVMTNDRALLWSSASELCAQFKSEAGGPLGGLGLARNLPKTAAGAEQFSPYALCVNSARQVYARGVQDNKQYKVDMPDRAVLFLASTVGAAAYADRNFNLKHVADDLYAARASMTTVGDELPAEDRLQAQTKIGYSSGDVYAIHSEWVADYCREGANYSMWRCIGVSMGTPGM